MHQKLLFLNFSYPRMSIMSSNFRGFLRPKESKTNKHWVDDKLRISKTSMKVYFEEMRVQSYRHARILRHKDFSTLKYFRTNQGSSRAWVSHFKCEDIQGQSQTQLPTKFFAEKRERLKDSKKILLNMPLISNGQRYESIVGDDHWHFFSTNRFL